MENIFTQGMSDRPAVEVFADPEGLAINLTELLLANYCRVKVISEKLNEWNILSNHLKTNENFEIKRPGEKERFIDYQIYISKVFAKNVAYDDNYFKKEENLIKEIRNTNLEKTKKFFIFPYQINLELYGKYKKIFEQNFRDIGSRESVIFVGQLVGPRIKLSERDLISRMIMDAVFSNVIRTPTQDININSVSVGDVSRKLIKELFSFGMHGNSTAILGPKIPIKKFSELIHRKFNIEERMTEETWDLREFQTDKKVIIETNLTRAVNFTVEWFKKNQPEFLLEKSRGSSSKKTIALKTTDLSERQVSYEKQETSKEDQVSYDEVDLKENRVDSFWNRDFKLKRVSTKRLIFGVIFTLFVLVFLPTGTLLLASGSMLIAKEKLSNDPSKVKKYFVIADASAYLAQKEFRVLTKIPLLGMPYRLGLKYSDLIKQTSELGLKTVSLFNQTKTLTDFVFGSEPYDVESISKNLSIDLDDYYKKISFLEGEISGFDEIGSDYTKRFFTKINLAKKKKEVLAGKKIVDNLPMLLGQNEDKTYLILFQNNMELRPTGGFIGSFSLVKFSKGRMVDINIMDVYSADGQLKGHVEPPEPIKKYLENANWFLRDSNWDPDFGVSAERAEWFLNKEIDQSVDGVIAIDVQLLKDTLEFLGPIYIKDFQKQVDKDNIYEVTQYEVEKDFFPGSRKKENFLTAVYQEITEELIHPKSENYHNLFRVLYKNLEERHIQIFIHDNQIQKTISALGWDGAVVQPKCDIANCYADWVGINEANVGVNKSNYYLERSTNLSISLEPGYIERELSLSLKSNATTDLGYQGVYRAYIRVMLPTDAKVESVVIEDMGRKEEVSSDIEYVRGRQDVGFFVEVGSGTAGIVKLVWTSKTDLVFDENGEYRFYWRKQAGTGEDPISVNVSSEVKLKTYPPHSLTSGESIVYNTSLLKDFIMKANW